MPVTVSYPQPLSRNHQLATGDLPSPIPADLLDEIVQQTHPEKVVLFGSRALGTAYADSDIDLFIQIDTGRDTRAVTKQLYALLRRSPSRPPLGIDVVVKDRAFVERYGELVGTVVRSVLREGRILYAR